MKKELFIAAASAAVLVLGVLLFPQSARSQSLIRVPVYCSPGKSFIENLHKRHKEQLSGMGLSDGMLTQLYKSKSGGWTILILNPEGEACTIAFGTDWETVVMVEGEPVKFFHD